MASATGFINPIIGQSLCFKSTNRLHYEIKIVLKHTYTKKAMNRKRLEIFAAPQNDSTTDDKSSFSMAQTIMRFYSAINEKNIKQLDKLISEDCIFEDYSFPTPFEGKKEVMNFLRQLVFCMGQNMEFNVEHICEGKDDTVGVNWHLDWNKIQVPFTRGCSNYSLSIKGDKLVIKKAQVLIESPVKLGVVALTVFKIVTSLFDAYPAATEWFLKSPHVLFHLLLKAYNIALRPIISPILEWYIKLLNFAVYILSFILRLLYYIAKFFNM
ncbi:hypothetical protein CDL12_09377 [Handroanthus impetiginosus]|uniref:SnoaL-like domain-containing protein n=1 Tax=Handroanthus impetiginosus TaxID=429701 RepID=A0A2G9HKB6_9LAMI|nr:hypothetical protein CDL12_09377 [Handroanthus impetiginosus]